MYFNVSTGIPIDQRPILSTRKNAWLTQQENKNYVISEGIHVYCSPMHAYQSMRNNSSYKTILVRVTVEPEDFVASNSAVDEAVFTKVRLACPEEIRKDINQFNIGTYYDSIDEYDDWDDENEYDDDWDDDY